MTAQPIIRDNLFHAATARSDRNRQIPIVKAKGVVSPLPSPLEFDPRVKPFRILDCIASAILCAAIIAPLAILFWRA
jgi:hypothetical protein